MLVLAGGRHRVTPLVFSTRDRFFQEVTGILVMRIGGDDRWIHCGDDLVEKLNRELPGGRDGSADRSLHAGRGIDSMTTMVSSRARARSDHGTEN